MHVQIVEFGLDGLTEDGYREACERLAPALAEVPGLLAKVWLAADDGTYGGVYLFRDRGAMEAYASSELFATVATFPNFTDVRTRDFGVLEGLTRLTQREVRFPVGAPVP
jgi:Putative mono-oxygenase ydhR